MQCPPSTNEPDDEAHGRTCTPTASTTERDATAVPIPSRCDKDDLDLMLLHEDFPLLLTMAAKVKELRNTGGTAVAAHAPRDPPTGPSHDEFEAAKRIQSKILSSTLRTGQSLSTVHRGQYPMTDIMMDDALMELQDEIDAYEFQTATDTPISPISNDLVAVLSDGLGMHRSTSASDRSQGQHPPSSIHYDPKKKGDAIAIKYSKWQTDILMGWMIANSESPFPDPSDVAELAESTGLTHSQVVNWTTNVRKRNLKATCRGNKKPHHFIDFLFLKQDQEGRLKGRDAGGIRYPPPSHTTSDSELALLVPSSTTQASQLLATPPTVQPKQSYREARGSATVSARNRQRVKDPHPEPMTEPASAPFWPTHGEAHELEPLEWKLPEQAKTHGLQHQELLQDFANYWTDDDEDSTYFSATVPVEAAQRGVDDLAEASWLTSPTCATQNKPPARPAPVPSRELHTRHRRMLMPSVTQDSHEDERLRAPDSTARGRRSAFFHATREGQWKRNRAPTPPPLDELFLYPTDLEEDANEYHQLNSQDSRNDERYEDEDEDDWINAWDIDEPRPLNL